LFQGIKKKTEKNYVLTVENLMFRSSFERKRKGGGVEVVEVIG